jgi:hypothetical protein
MWQTCGKGAPGRGRRRTDPYLLAQKEKIEEQEYLKMGPAIIAELTVLQARRSKQGWKKIGWMIQQPEGVGCTHKYLLAQTEETRKEEGVAKHCRIAGHTLANGALYENLK